MITMKQALQRIKGNLPRFLPENLLSGLADRIGLVTRDRTLTPPTTASLFLRQVLHGNVSVGELRRLALLDFTESAYCQARGRLPVGYFQQLTHTALREVQASLRNTRRGLWMGRHRIFLLDGSSFSMPDTEELRETFSYPSGQKEGCGFPTAHLLVRTDLEHGYILDAIPAPWHTHDMAHAEATHAGLRPGDVVLADRGFSSYAHLALLHKREVYAVFRMHQRQRVDFTPRRPHALPGDCSPEAKGKPRSRWLRSLGEQDQVVQYFKPKERPEWMSREEYARLPASMLVREVRFKVRDPNRRVKEVTLATTLLDAEKYSKEKLAKLYEQRWWVEEHLKQLKQQMQLDILRCKSVPGVLKEMYVIVTVYNVVRRVMAEAARKQGVRPNRISFADALYWLRYAKPGEEVPRLKEVPKRPGRAEPRKMKRRPKPYSFMIKPRAVWKQALMES